MKKRHPSFKNLAGIKFGNLLVVSEGEKTNDKKTKWICLCDCGNKREVIVYLLVHGKVTKCKKCMQPKGPIGRKFGKLKVIKKHKGIRIGTAQKITYIYECLCDCGKTSYVRACNLYAGHAKSCGCLQGKILPKGLSAKRDLFATYKHNAKQRKLVFNIMFDQFISLTSKNCHYCNKSPEKKVFSKKDLEHSNGNYIYNRIDRVNNNKGYTIDNIVSCCTTCNLAKRSMTMKEFLNWIKNVYNYSIKNKRNRN